MRKSDKFSDRVSLKKSKRRNVDIFCNFLNLIPIFSRYGYPVEPNHILEKKIKSIFVNSLMVFIL